MKIAQALPDFQDIKEVCVGNTRKDRAIDRVFLNISRAVFESGTLDPLETDEEDSASDYRIAYCRLELPRLNAFRWETYTYRYFNEESNNNFKSWMVLHPWTEVFTADGTNNKSWRSWQPSSKSSIVVLKRKTPKIEPWGQPPPTLPLALNVLARL